jgi:signal transduction histidine kinase
VRALYALKDDVLVLDAEQKAFRLSPATGEVSAIHPEQQNAQLRILGMLKDGNLCVEISEPGNAEPNRSLKNYDGARFTALVDSLAASLIGSNLQSFFNTQNGDLWVSSDSGIASYHDNQWHAFTSSDNTTPAGALSFIELENGRIWCGAKDRIWEFDGISWAEVRGGFDGINGMLRARDGSFWVASNNGLDRFYKGAWVENGIEEGLPSSTVREVAEDRRGRVWAATARGLSYFYPEADADPPRTTIQQLNDQEQSLPEGAAFSVSFMAQDKWKLTPRSRLLFSYRLDQRDWSPFQEGSTVSFSDLVPGKHSFQVRAMDRNCNAEQRPAEVTFGVVLPWYKEPRLFWISMTGLATALFFAGLAFNRHRQLVKSYAEVEKKIEERTRELEQANRELLHSQKMKALGTIAAGIAHDFNNILSIIKGSAQIIEENLDSPQKVLTRLDRIKTVVEQGAGIVKAMLGFTRESARQPAFCDVNVVAEDTLKLLGDRFLREVEVRFEPAEGLVPILCPKDFIQQILLNFIFNAEESMTERKKIVLRTWSVPTLERLGGHKEGGGGGASNGLWLALVPAQHSDYVCIGVQDSGCGIAPENLPRIFEPFFTTKSLSARRGTGLGLSMAYELAKKMEAGLAVQSVPNQGSTFMLILPVREAQPDGQNSNWRPGQKPEVRNAKPETNPKVEIRA